MQQLSAFTNVIPVIAKSETLTTQELISLKTSILARLQAASIKPFLFGKPLDDALLAVQGLDIVYPLATPTTAIHTGEPKEPNQFPFPIPTHPYAISSACGSDNDTMDASLLMSPDYVQPLMSSELSNLIEQVFDPESIAWLRHAAAKKFLAWRRRTKLPGDSFILQGLRPTTASVGLNGTMMNREHLHPQPIHKLTPSSISNIFCILCGLSVGSSCPPQHLPLLLTPPVPTSRIFPLTCQLTPCRPNHFLPRALQQ
jgi:hypothetical protein